jgi:cell division protein FtsQ
VARRLGLLDNVKAMNRFSFLVGGIAVFILIFSLVYYIVENHFLIERINIVGNTTHITEKQLEYIARNKLHGTFFTLNISELQHAFRQVPWVKQVSVTRRFPDTLTVSIIEYSAIARLGDFGLIAPDGRVFSGADANIALPVFYVSQSQISNTLQYYKILQPLLNAESVSLVNLVAKDPGITKFSLSNGLQVIICGADFTSGIATLSKYWTRLYTLNAKLQYINMCYNNALAINAIPKELTKTGRKDDKQDDI